MQRGKCGDQARGRGYALLGLCWVGPYARALERHATGTAQYYEKYETFAKSMSVEAASGRREPP